MKLALQYEMQRPYVDDHKVVQETMEQCVLADEVGFDYLWFVEHHFLTGFSASPCPDLFYAAVSQRTQRIFSEILEGVPQDERDLIVGGNCARIYGFEPNGS